MDRNAEILLDLASRDSLSDADASKELSALTVIMVGDSPLLEIENLLLMTGEWGAIEETAHSGPSFELRALCRTAVRLFTDSKEKYLGWGDDPNIPIKVESLLSNLVLAGLMDDSTKSAILAMKLRTVLKYNPSVHHLEVAKARGRG
jgi:hypothetical protein